MAQAVATFDELLLISPLYQDAIFERALCLSQMGYVNEAVEGFQNALEIKMSEKDHAFNENDDDNGDSDGSNQRPGREEIYLANILLEGRGDKQAALDIYQRCGSNSALVTVAGVCLDSLGRHDEAKKCYEQGLELVGGDADFETMIHKCINLYRSEQKLTQEEKKYSDNNSSSNSSRSSSIEEIMTKVESSTSSHIASSWEYISNQPKVWSFPSVHYFTHDMVQLAMQNTSLENGLILEFGVYYGKTIRMMAEYFPNDVIHGFDTFEGLPGDWFNTKQGSYSTDGTLPSVPDNVNFYKGLFSETLPDFLANQPSELPIRLMNIDCDMYASTKDVFDLVHNRVKPGTIIIFDEYIQNPNWKEDEYKAFQEAVERFGWKYEYIAISMTSQQAIVRIL
jgi:tetratricopeptide (TPR) repeat protein